MVNNLQRKDPGSHNLSSEKTYRGQRGSRKCQKPLREAEGYVLFPSHHLEISFSLGTNQQYLKFM